MFNIGDMVDIKDSKLTGKITKIRKDKEKFRYVVCILDSNTNIIITEDRLTPSLKKVSNNKKVNLFFKLNEDDKIPENEIMLRHQTVEVAMENLDIFISKCVCTRQKRVKIIHGKHGGILRNAVSEYLKNSPYVDNFHLAEYYEGSYGVTIAYLK